MSLDAADIDAIAVRVAELLAEDRADQQPAGLVDATTAAKMLGVSRGTIYAKAKELGAVRIGTGAKARLRFDPANLLAQQEATSAPTRRPERRRRKPSRNVPLLPVSGGRRTQRGPLTS
jgi:hypothetical protein